MKAFKKSLAVFLAILTIFTVFSTAMPVFAMELQTDGNAYEYKEEKEPAYIISELTNKREENIKHFALSDGSFIAAEYNTPVHYQTESGEWLDIDNSLQTIDASAEQTALFGTEELYGTGNSADNVVFAKKGNSNTLVSYEAVDYPISLNYQSAKNSTIKITEDKKEYTGDDKFLTLPDISSEVIYENIYSGVDLQYIVSPDKLKENIILKNKNAQKTFTVNYNIGSLTAEVVDEKTVNLLADDKVVYTISAPYMYDNNGVKSDAVTLVCDKNHNGKLRIDIAVDEAWLNDENRAYPVIIDPSIESSDYNSLTGTYISSAAPAVNYGDISNDLTVSKNDATSGNSYALIKLNNLSSNNAGDHVVSATLNLPVLDVSANTTAYMHEITSAWDETTVTWNTKPVIASNVTDYCNLTTESTALKFDITKIYKRNGADTDLSGVAVKLNEDGKVNFSTQNENEPVLLMKYISTVGIDDKFSYSEFDMGSAGYVYINNLSGNLVLSRDEIDSTGENYAYDFGMTYNSFGNVIDTASMWFPSYMSTIYLGETYLDEDGSVETLNKGEKDENDIYTLEGNKAGWDELKIIDYFTVTIPFPEIFGGPKHLNFPYTVDAWKNEGAEKYRFNWNGLLNKWVCENGTEKLVFSKENVLNEDGTQNENAFRIVDGDGDKLLVNTADNYEITQIDLKDDGTAINGDTVTYVKNENETVTEIKLNGNTQALFTYDESGRMTSITNDSGYKLTFTYEDGTKKIASVEESKGDEFGSKIAFERTYNSTDIRSSGADGVFGNNDDVISTYKFNEEAELTNVYNSTVDGDDLGATAYEYSGNSDSFGGLSKVSAIGKSTENLLKNHNFEIGGSWTNGKYYDANATGSFTWSTADAYHGNRSVVVSGADFTANGLLTCGQRMIASDLNIQSGDVYTASAYVKTTGLTFDSDVTTTTGYGAGVLLRFIDQSGAITLKYSDFISETNQDTNGGWQRVFVTAAVPENTVYVDYFLTLRNANGTAYFDCVQFEKGDAPSSYNLLENNGFTYVDSNNYATNWNRYNLTANDNVIDGKMKINGVTTKKTAVYQDIELSGATQEDNYVYSAWATADAMPKGSGRHFGLYPIVYYKDAEGDESSVSQPVIYYDVNDVNTQYISGSISLKHPTGSTLTPVRIRICVCYYRQCNAVLYDNVCLYRSGDVYDLDAVDLDEEDENSVYDESGNLTSYTDFDGTVYEYTYHPVNADGEYALKTETITETVDGTEKVTVYEYDTSEKLVKETTPENKVYTYSYDNLGNLLSKLTSDGVGDSYTYAYYDTDGDNENDDSDLLSETLEDGMVYTYTYDSERRYTGETKTKGEDVESTAYTYDGRGNLTQEVYTKNGVSETTTYTYDAMDNLLTQTNPNGTSNTYTYNYYDTNGDGINDKSAVASESLEDGTQNTYTYYSYGKLKNQTSSKGGMSLTYNYDTDGNMTKLLHNGIEYNYAYDNFGNPLSVKVGSQALVSYSYQADKTKLSSMTYGNGDTVSYGYDAYGNVTRVTTDLGKVSTMYDPNGKIIHQNDIPGGIKTTYHYDKKGNFTGETVTNTQPRSTYNFLYSNFFEYDADGRISKNILKSANAGISTTYNYDEEDNPSETVMGATRKVNYAYDEDGLLTGKTLTTNTAVNESFTYNDDELISTHTIGGEEYNYTYDSEGNITSIEKDGVASVSYVYDLNNQLIRENNLDINKTITYTYDNGGNILSKQEYAYTTGDLGAVVDTITYQYADNAWTDKLTSYDGQSISYDEIGNPTNYMGAAMSWYGRQLKTYTKNDTSISYKYDVDGLRTQKIVNGVKHEYYYVDGQLRYERNGDSYEIYYTYDLNGVPVHATKRDLVEKKNYQLYLITNTRGDVIEMRDGSGNVRGRNIYDSWGKVIAVVDQNGSALGSDTFQYQISLKYRGYVYDHETGLYYLQSRYYDPETGRFLNADSVDYIGATGTDLSYNLFAYCENDAVNGYDPTGNKRIEFSATWIDYAVEVILMIFFPTFKWKLDILGELLESVMKRFGFRNFAKYLLKSVVPKWKGIFSKGFTFIRKAIWRITGATLSWGFSGMISTFLDNFAKKILSNSISLYYVYKIGTAITSVGGLVSLALDYFSDKKINDRVVLYI